jgi:hypothetical protein
MQNLSDEELDNRMKQAGEFQDYAYDEASWQNVKERLDKPTDGATWITPVRIFSIAALLAVLLLGTWVYINNNDPSKVSAEKGENNKTPLLASAESGPVSSEATDLLSSENVQAVLSNESADRLHGNNSQETYTSRKSPPSSANTYDKYKEPKEAQSTETNIQPDVKSFIKNNEASLLASTPTPEPKLSSKKKSEGLTYEVVLLTDSTNNVSETAKEVLRQDSLLVKEELVKEKKVGSGLWSIKFSISPDWSAQSFSETSDLGFNYGMALEYRLSNSIGIAAGILKARKYYTAQNIEYGPYSAEYAEGDCNMWDIPVQLNYYFTSARSLQAFASIGLSSYLMSKENYTYYPNADNKAIRYTSKVENENNEWFKVLNLSVGLQRPLTKSVFIQVEPFVKVPLGEMGAGNIAISSIGLFLNFKYQPKK